MGDHLCEIQLEQMFEEFITGEDPSAECLTHCRYDALVADVANESELNLMIVR